MSAVIWILKFVLTWTVLAFAHAVLGRIKTRRFNRKHNIVATQ